MSISESDIAFIYELFQEIDGLSHRKMMGGLSLYADGQIFAILSAEGVPYLKAKGDFARAMMAEGSTRFEMGDGRGMDYYTLPDSALDDPSEASAWGRRALAALR